ncbi:MAG: electron transporter RnfD [Spirochaetes bacterium]|nr:MAG: electron transporter RnfD [Spirochaetota bacterium]RKX97177.1 MAG: electron transporter RnfD [Spirochaetota bacterium]
MEKEISKVIVSTSPHIKSNETVSKIMLSVIITLLPAVAFSIYLFGTYVLLMYVVSVATSVISEYIVVKLRKRPFTLNDLSAVVTGILLVMVLPPKFPIYGVIIGAFVGIVIGKQIFGGLGHNIFNPALIGRAFLAAAYPVHITTWVAPRIGKISAVSGATPLAAMKFGGVVTRNLPLFLGTVGGSVGETSALLLIVGSIYLFIKRYIKWQIPVSIFITVAVLGEIFHLINPVKYPGPLFHLLSGGLMIGALYMATDMVTSPLTGRGCVIFGIGIGTLVIVIRLFGGLPEGVMYSILFMNAFVPLINRAKPRIFGTEAVHEK